MWPSFKNFHASHQGEVGQKITKQQPQSRKKKSIQPAAIFCSRNVKFYTSQSLTDVDKGKKKGQTIPSVYLRVCLL